MLVMQSYKYGITCLNNFNFRNMTKKGYIIYFIIFIVIYTFLTIILFDKKLNIELIFYSLLASALSITIIYFAQKIIRKKENNVA